MNWEFILIDRNGISHAIDEPVGWDGISIEIKRDLDTHGAFFDYSTNDFEFHGEALSIIREEYEEYGIEGNIILVIRQGCKDSIEELYRGKLLFGKYEYTCSSMCFVKIPIETTGDLMDLKNRWDQKVDLQTIKAFDGITVLPAYNKLGFDLTLPSKAVLLSDYSIKKQQSSETVANGLEILIETDASQQATAAIELPLDDIASELGNYGFSPTIAVTSNMNEKNPDGSFSGNRRLIEFEFTPGARVTQELWDGANWVRLTTIPSDGNWYNPDFISPIINYQEGTNNYNVDISSCNIDYLIEGELEPLNNSGFGDINLVFYKKDVNGNFTFIKVSNVCDAEFLSANTTYKKVRFSLPFSSNMMVNKGDQFFLFLIGRVYSENQSILDGTNQFKLTISNNSFFKLKVVSKTADSTAKVFMINEALSRTVEAITNDKIRAYSNYFGRTDSQPYNHAQDGCGSLEIITKGLFVRKQENRIAGQPFAMAVSMQDLWQGLEPIHHVGFGVEADTNRPGYNRLRIEHWKYFYKQDVIMSCDGIASIEKKVIENEHYSTFKFGFEKWEAEEYNGLDEFLTKRQYRTTLNQVKNEFSRLSKFIASGYALEITRRKANIDSKDWRYDNDTFIVCCKRNNAGDIVVELGNIINPQNVLDPATLYNYRISPLRNAMKWLDKVLASYKKTNPNNKVIFMDGDGNYHARGEMESAFCKWENQILEENHDLDLTIFADATKSTPILKPERIEFEYPLSIKEFKTILNNPYGKIYYSGACEDGYGWIDSIKYKPEEGLADFKLIPNYQ